MKNLVSLKGAIEGSLVVTLPGVTCWLCERSIVHYVGGVRSQYVA